MYSEDDLKQGYDECPVCGSTDIRGFEDVEKIDADNCFGTFNCNDCGTEWAEYFTFTNGHIREYGVVEDEDGDE